MTALDLKNLTPKYPTMRECARKGKKDGKEAMPAADWQNPAPFVERLAKTAAARNEEIGKRLRQALNRSASRIAELLKIEPIYAERVAIIKRRRDAAEQRVNSARALHEGVDPNKGPTTGAGLRTMSRGWHNFALIALGIGEFAVTLKAFEELLDETSRLWEWQTPQQIEDATSAVVLPLRWNNFGEITEPVYMVIELQGLIPIFLTFATASLFIIYAHFLGITIKRHNDRLLPQPNWVLWAMVPVGVLITLAATGLAVIRSTATEIVRRSAGRGEVDETVELAPWFLQWGILFPTFLLIQLGLIVIAAAVSYSYYSTTRQQLDEAEKELNKASKDLAKEEKQHEALLRQIEIEQEQAQHMPREAIAAVNHERRVCEMLAANYIDNSCRSQAKQVTAELSTVTYADVSSPSWLDSWEYVKVSVKNESSSRN